MQIEIGQMVMVETELGLLEIVVRTQSDEFGDFMGSYVGSSEVYLFNLEQVQE